MLLPALTTDASSVLQTIRPTLSEHSFLQMVQYVSHLTSDNKFYTYANPYTQAYFFTYPI
jgi:hypothetical protein